jgi:peroxiredoxin
LNPIYLNISIFVKIYYSKKSKKMMYLFRKNRLIRVRETLISFSNYFILIVIFGVFGCKTSLKHGGFTISGTVKNADGKELILSKLTTGTPISVDTAKLDAKGNFQFKGHTSFPEFYMLSISQSEYINLLVDSAQQVTLNTDASKFSESYTVEGSPDSKLLKYLFDRLSVTIRELDSINTIYKSKQTEKNTDSLRAALSPQMIKTVNLLKKDTRSFIDNNPNSLSTLIALSLSVAERTPVLTLSEDMAYYEKVDKNLSAKYPGSDAVKSLHTYLAQVKNEKSLPGVVAVGQDAPEISMPSPEGKTLNLSSLRGNYVLLDFWASWCKPCRGENPNLVSNYSKYKNKGFKIFQVSLDQTADAWKQAIAADKLNWNHVSDLQYWNSAAAKLYGVQSIPANFLIDPQGKVIAVDLRGDLLGQELLKIYGF